MKPRNLGHQLLPARDMNRAALCLEVISECYKHARPKKKALWNKMGRMDKGITFLW